MKFPKIRTTDPTWEDIVFENRNQQYGAYPLRRHYSLNVMAGVGVTIVLIILALTYPLIIKWFADGESLITVPPRKLVYTELMAPPPIDRPKPPPPNVALPKLQKVIKFVPPQVVKEEVITEIPTIEELKTTDIAATASVGDAEVFFEEPVETVVEDNADEIFTVVEQQPEFAGGFDALADYLRSNMKYPALARKMGIEGTVHVSFLISKTGAISEVTVLRGIMPDCDKEAIRVVQKMPSWKHGRQNGHAVHVRLVMPLKFRLN